MAREDGYMYLLAIGSEHSEVLEGPQARLRDPGFSAIETSDDGKLGYMRIPAEVSRLTIPSGVAIRVGSLLGSHLAQNKQWRVLTSEEYYRRGHTQPDPYALQEEVARLEVKVKLLESAAKEKASEPEPESAEPEDKPTTSPRTRGKSK